uniref:Glyco_hydro_3 domain-containing protein n=1 Tax=Globodera pallida TaxID=36090 RepID=A0A183CSM3_GLOPA
FLQQPCVIILLKNLDHGRPDLATATAAITDLAERGHAVLANRRGGGGIRMDTE